MSRQLKADISSARFVRRADTTNPLNQRKSLQAKLQTTPVRTSPYHRTGSFKAGPASSRSASSVGGSPRPFFDSDDDLSSSGDDNDDLGSKHIPGIKLPVPTLAMSSRKASRTQLGKKPAKVSSTKKERARGERKASVRKERFEELDTDSDLTDVPSDDDIEHDDALAGPSYSGLDKGKARSMDGDSDDLQSDSDTEMERKLAEAGDGESLLGSGASGEDTEEEEERFIIQDALDRQSKAKARLQHRDPSDRRRHAGERDSASKSDLHHRARSIAIRRGSNVVDHGGLGDDAEADVEDEDNDEEDDDDDGNTDADLLSMSPATLRMYGLPVIEDELFEEQEAFNSSSEPSFTDFFETSTDSEMDIANALDENGDDDDEFTTDSDEDHDISDLEGGLLDAPLIAHIGTTSAADDPNAVDTEEVTADGTVQPKPEMPLLVIEDLDGRLIYARAGDGEAVFGSDGEFEFVDDSDDDSADWEFDRGGNRLWSGVGGSNGLLAPEDDGDTTDELPDEDMPYPRLLVGSVAPRGGRNARRARAMATNSRRLSPAVTSPLPSPSLPQTADVATTTSDSSGEGKLSGSGSRGSPASSDGPASNEVGITISTEQLARDPEGTLKAAAAALGVSLQEAATLVAGVQLPVGSVGEEATAISNGSGTSSVDSTMAAPQTPEQQRIANIAKPQMGSFMPTSAKSVHRAVIDGSRKAPSPFSGKRSLERKGLAKKRRAARRSSLLGDEGLSAKRLRRFSSANDAASAIDEYSEMAPSSPEPIVEVDPMELDDVVDSSMIWRGTGSKSPSPEMETGDGIDGGRRPSARSSRKISSAPGLNLNAFARWNKIPMGSFRDSQAAPAPSQNAFQQQHQHQQPLGTFLLTRSQGQSGSRAPRTSSPFRTSSNAVRNPEMFSISPLRQLQEGDSKEGGASSDSMSGRRRSFIISPVLFPTRGGEIPPPSSSASTFGAHNAPTYSHIAGLRLGGSSVAGGDAASVASNTSAGPGRITRREKREKRAKRAAMLASQTEEGAALSPGTMADHRAASGSPAPAPTTPLLQLSSLPDGGFAFDEGDSPATAFPRMRITDATPTPRGSPAPSGPPAVGKDLLQPGSNLKPSSQVDIANASPTSTQAVERESMAVSESHAEDQDKQEDASSVSASMSGALPSSACKTPLHSPLFGGIFGGALNYDLEDKEAEPLRI
ncbi:predicted midasin [Pseudozyma hubeiensis SY62]|uniref:Predicted midasin n=1 Tax=Pseudozyma hubeiensis (strain SY62) TaxID=1305764 RepID=R9P6X3_PSEHS|nr:predicted midasin [Pseudozyma hubeiensis SY62]GAC96997.1 predicted midasin [Pseudozyma hubeiensis SY62]